MTSNVPYYDVLILGGGFSGCYLLHHLRKQGYNAHIFEKGAGLGGTWFWNRYPGARVDSDIPVYELSIPEVYNTWTWTERFPGWAELRKYFKHVDKTLNISKDTDFNTCVTDATWDEKTQTWDIRAANGKRARAQFFLPCIGFASKNFTPDFKGLTNYKGEVHHTNEWPEEGIDMTGRKIALIGTGSTGVQITQEAGPVCKELNVFQRTPNLVLPMQQQKLTAASQSDKSDREQFYKHRTDTYAGFDFTFVDKDTLDDPPEVREKFYQSLFDYGGFTFWVATYRDIFYSKEGNALAYDFWRRKAHERIKDPKTAEILAPTVAPHPFGTKRPSLEQNYYEQFNRPNVNVVDINAEPLVEFTAKGLKTTKNEYEFDLLILATGFDAVTGSFKLINVRGVNGVKLGDKWANATSSYLGLAISGFPNMFYTYGPQAPTAFSNGPTTAEVQSDFAMSLMNYMRENNLRSVNANIDAEVAYTKDINDEANRSLFPLAKSWYMGANIPGKPIEMLNYIKGIPAYKELLEESEQNNWKGFTLSA
ncbi:FAD/NAD(P)-binding domain-protein [Kockiozyma suomiensis]|uniref:FAD/NAD(P)-binding domain-protein n=1 Tax=Kockiozyma suomiensis TaxID=1337062 RepID=UPI003343D64A